MARRRLRFRPRHLQYALAHGIVASVLYLLGYWGTFQINPLEHIGIVDVVKLAVYPLSTVLVVGIAIVGAVHVAIAALGRTIVSVERRVDAFISSRSKLAASLLRLGSLLLVLVAQGVWLHVTRDVEIGPLTGTLDLTVWHFVLGIAIWLCGWLAFTAASDPLISAFIGSRLTAFLFFFLISAPIVITFPAGRVKAHERLRDGCAPIEVDVSRSSALTTSIAGGTYLGYLGEHVFVREWKTGAIVVTKLAPGQSMVLLPLDTRSDGRPAACAGTAGGSPAATDRAPQANGTVD